MNTTYPLSGVRVLDLSRVLAGPLCTMMLGDLGADIIKVERPETGDDTRGWGPPFDAAGSAAYFLSVNRNKLSLAADFARADDATLVRELIGGADVVIDNYLPGVLRRHGIDADALLAEHPRLIWCTISGFGPESRRPGYDFVVQAECGWMAITGPEQGPPTKTGVALADVIAGKDAAIAILAALHGRDNGAIANRRLHISLAHSATAALVNVAQNAAVTGKDARRWGNAHPNLVPYQLFDAADRPIVLAVGSDPQWLVAMRALGLPELADAADLATNAGRLARREEVVAAIASRIASANAETWMTALNAVGVPCGLVRSVAEALTDVDISATHGVSPATGGSIRRDPPALDAHGKEIRKMQWSAFN